LEQHQQSGARAAQLVVASSSLASSGSCSCHCPGQSSGPDIPPEFYDDDDPDYYEFSVPEDAIFGDAVGNAFADNFTGDPTYTITGGDPTDVFGIDPTTGQLMVAVPSQLVDGDIYLLNLEVADAFGTDTGTAQITVVAAAGAAPPAVGSITNSWNFVGSYGGKGFTFSAGAVPERISFRQVRGPATMPILPFPRTDYWYGQWGHRTDGSLDAIAGSTGVTGTNTIERGNVCNTVGGKDAGTMTVRALGFATGANRFRIEFQFSVAATEKKTGGFWTIRPAAGVAVLSKTIVAQPAEGGGAHTEQQLGNVISGYWEPPGANAGTTTKSWSVRYDVQIFYGGADPLIEIYDLITFSPTTSHRRGGPATLKSTVTVDATVTILP